MIEIEARLRRGLDEAAATQGVPPGFDERVARRVTVVRRRRVAARGAFVAVALALVVGSVVAFRPDSSTQKTVAGAPPNQIITGPGWQPMAEAPISARFQALSIAMGGRVLVWGGYDHETRTDGAVYDTATATWTKVPDSPFSSGDAVGAWTGREAIVLSGDRGNVHAAAYDPGTNAWRELADPPLANGASALNHAIWTGTELVVVGVAEESESGVENQVAIYDPGADSWRSGTRPPGPLPDFGDAVWTGTEVAVVGHVNGSGKSIGNDVVQVYDPTTDRWREIRWGIDGVRSDAVVAWTGNRLFIGGGRNVDNVLRDAALLDLATGAWERLPDAPIAFAGSSRFGELWTGSTVLTLNGEGNRPVSFDPATREWQVGPAAPAGVRRDEVSWAWVEPRRAALVWSGGLSEADGPGMTGCCTPIEGGETYTP